MPIARLIADKATLETRLDNASKAFAEANLPLAEAQLLENQGEVLHLSFADGDHASIRALLNEHFDTPDMVVADRVEIPNLLVSDMDSTMIGQECIDELADFAGLKDQVSQITERAMQGELDFESALLERVALLRGLDEHAIQSCLDQRITPMAGAQTLVATLKAHGCRCVLVTGGFHHFADPVATMLGFERVVGNRLAVVGGELSGQLDGPVSDGSTKMRVLEEERAKLGDVGFALATGDGANDIPMIKAAELGLAYHAKQKARDAANGHVGKGDLTTILRLLGIAEGDWQAY